VQAAERARDERLRGKTPDEIGAVRKLDQRGVALQRGKGLELALGQPRALGGRGAGLREEAVAGIENEIEIFRAAGFVEKVFEKGAGG